MRTLTRDVLMCYNGAMEKNTRREQRLVDAISPFTGKPVQVPAQLKRRIDKQMAILDPPRSAKPEAQAKGVVPEPKLYAGIYTLRGPKGHRTYRVKPVIPKAGDDPAGFRRQNEGRLILSLLTGPDNERNYTSLAWVSEAGVSVWKRHQGTQMETLARVFYQFVVRNRLPQGGYRVEVSKRCRRCWRTLTNPDSLDSEYGPECRKKM